MGSTGIQQQLSEVRELLLVSWQLESDEEELHYHHPTRQHVKLPDSLKKAHEKARMHSDHAVNKTARMPPDQRALFHRVAAGHSKNASQKLHAAGFHGLGNYHDAARQHHDAESTRRNRSQPKRDTHAGVERPHQRASEPEHRHPPEVMKKLHKSWEAAHRHSDEASAMHHSQDVPPKHKSAAHRKAFKALVHIANELGRHGFHDHAHQAMTKAHAHLSASSSR